MARFHTYYDNLKVPRTASTEVIRVAYRRLSQKHHPDRNPDNPDAARVMVLLNIAYRALSDPTKRAEHDRWITQQEARCPAPEASIPPREEAATPRKPPRKPARESHYETYYVHPYLSEELRLVIRGAFLFLAILLVGIPVLASITALWELPPWPADKPATLRPATAHAPDNFARSLVQIRPRDPSGIYRLVKSDFRIEGGEPVIHSKGKLEIRRLRENTYLILEAKTIRSTGTRGDADLYHVRPGRYAFDKLELHHNSRNWAVLEGDQLVKQEIGANFDEITWWQRVPEGYSEKYLDRRIKEAEWVYKVRVERGVAEK